MQYSLDQYTLIAKNTSPVESRSQCNILDSNGKCRIFASPMTSILDKDNFDKFLNSQFIPIYPIWHDEELSDRLNLSAEKNCWIAVSLREFGELIYNPKKYIISNNSYNILIDCADGHMEKIFEMIKYCKSHFSNIKLMIGNIENPKTYIECCKAGADYVRVGVGGGKGCLSSVKLGYHASMGWLITSIQKIRTNWFFKLRSKLHRWTSTKVIADGGISNSAKIIKCLALGADYVMCGSLFARCEEARGDVRWECGQNVKKYYGQASEQGKIDRFGKCNGHIEGTTAWIPVTNTLDTLADELNDCLSSAMSYAGAFNWDEFIGKVEYDIQSDSEFKSYDKK